MQKQAAVWKFQKEQHDWLQLVFHYMSTELGNIEAPVFPSWVLRTPGQEEEKEKEETGKEEESEEKEEETDKEVEEEQQLRKRVTRKQAKGKKKKVVEPELEETYDSEEEDEELEKEMDEESEEEEEESDEVDSTEEDRARGVILEEIARQKYAKTSESAPQETTQTSPTKSPTKSPISSPTKDPSPPLKSPTIQPQIQSPPHSPPPPSPRKPEQPSPQSPSFIIANVVSDLMQEREEEGLNKEEGSEAVTEPEVEKEAAAMQTDAPASDAPAPDASVSEKTATTEHDEVAIKLVLEEMAKKKKEELGNTQKFFKTPALKKQAAKRKVAEPTDAAASLPASTTKENPASAPVEETPKQSKEKKMKVKHTSPTRQSSRTRSGAKK